MVMPKGKIWGVDFLIVGKQGYLQLILGMGWDTIFCLVDGAQHWCL
jgi:hypothetical protein